MKKKNLFIISCLAIVIVAVSYIAINNKEELDSRFIDNAETFSNFESLEYETNLVGSMAVERYKTRNVYYTFVGTSKNELYYAANITDCISMCSDSTYYTDAVFSIHTGTGIVTMLKTFEPGSRVYTWKPLENSVYVVETRPVEDINGELVYLNQLYYYVDDKYTELHMITSGYGLSSYPNIHVDIFKDKVYIISNSFDYNHEVGVKGIKEFGSYFEVYDQYSYMIENFSSEVAYKDNIDSLYNYKGSYIRSFDLTHNDEIISYLVKSEGKTEIHYYTGQKGYSEQTDVDYFKDKNVTKIEVDQDVVGVTLLEDYFILYKDIVEDGIVVIGQEAYYLPINAEDGDEMKYIGDEIGYVVKREGNAFMYIDYYDNVGIYEIVQNEIKGGLKSNNKDEYSISRIYNDGKYYGYRYGEYLGNQVQINLYSYALKPQ